MEELAVYKDVQFGRNNVKNVHYADELVMNADSEEKLMLMDKLILECSRLEKRINKRKTELLKVIERMMRFHVTISV